MREAIERHWTSFFYSGSIAVIVSWLLLITLSGCRFGNHVDNGPGPDVGVSGYYSTQPQTFTLTTTQTGGGGHTAPMDPSEIPSLLSAFFTNPATLLLLDPPSNTYAVFPPMTGIPSSSPLIQIASDGSFNWTENVSGSDSSAWFVPWLDPSCQASIVLTLQGKTTNLNPGDPTTANTDLGVQNLKGRIALQATSLTTFQGNCAPTWQAMSACYQVLASCPGATPADQGDYQAITQTLYKLFVQGQVLAPSEIASTQTLQYNVVYQ